MIGQTQILERLQQQIDEGRVPHAQLFCGPEGSGKLATAIDFAQRLLSYNADERGQRMAAMLQHPDLHFVFPVYKPDGQNGGATSDQFMTQWREMLSATHYFDLPMWMRSIGKDVKRVQIYTEESESILHKLTLVSSQGGYKVMIIWLPELMHVSCSNKILKILEEPPQQTIFILVSNHPEQLLDTIVSRCQRIDFKAYNDDDIANALIAERGLDETTARFIAHGAAGSYTRALQRLTTNEEEALFFDLFVSIMRISYQRDIMGLRTWSEQLASWGRERQKSFLDNCQRLIRENFIYNFHKPELNFMTQSESDFSVRFARFINERNVISLTEEFALAQRDIEQNTNAKMVFFDLAMKIIVLIRQ